MLDGKGLVYQKQGNTGAAAYNRPNFQIGANPLDVLANQVRAEAKAKAANDAKTKAANLKTLNVDLEGWDFDNKRYFAQMEDQLKKEGAAISLAKDINNLADDQVADWHKRVDKWEKAAKASANQGEMYKALIDTAAKDPDKYDLEATMIGGKEYMYMTPDKRLEIDPQTLLVRRYDPYGPVEGLNVESFGGTNAWRGLTSFSEKKSLNAKQLREEIKSRVNNPENIKFYNYNKERLGFETLKDYEDYLYRYKKNQFVGDNRGGIIDTGKSYGWSDSDYETNVANSAPLKVNSAMSLYTGWYGEPTDIYLHNAQGVNGVNLVIPGSEALSLSKNYKGIGPLEKQGNYELNEANMAIALVRTDNGQLMGINKQPILKTSTFNLPGSDGKMVTYTAKEAFDKGLVKYIPVIQGNGKYSEDGEIKYEPIVAEADKFITPDMVQKSAAENDAYKKYEALKKQADKYNEENKTKGDKSNEYRKKYEY